MTDLHFLAHPSGYGYIGEAIWCFLCFTISFIPLCTYLSYIWRYRRGGSLRDELSSKTSKAVELLTTTSMLCFCLALLIRGIYSILKITINSSIITNEGVISSFAGSCRLFWGIGEGLIHLLFIKRVQYAFKDTNYSTPKRIYRILYISIIIFLICTIIVVINHILHHFMEIDRGKYMATNFILTLIYTIIDLIVSGFLVKLFIDKLFIIIVEIDPNLNLKRQQINNIANNDKFGTLNGASSCIVSSIQSSQMSSNSNCKKQRFRLNQDQSSFLNIITKYFILNTISIISSQFVQFIAMIAQIMIIGKRDENGYHFLEDIFWCLWIIDCCINSLCIYLQLDMSQKRYNRGCRKIHICCALWCNKLAIRKVENATTNYVVLTDLNYHL